MTEWNNPITNLKIWIGKETHQHDCSNEIVLKIWIEVSKARLLRLHCSLTCAHLKGGGPYVHIQCQQLKCKGPTPTIRVTLTRASPLFIYSCVYFLSSGLFSFVVFRELAIVKPLYILSLLIQICNSVGKKIKKKKRLFCPFSLKALCKVS